MSQISSNSLASSIFSLKKRSVSNARSNISRFRPQVRARAARERSINKSLTETAGAVRCHGGVGLIFKV